MVEIGIPIFHAKETLPAALDSLVAQTKKNFIVCLSIDGDDEDYTDIINTYKARGLKIRVINGKFNGGAGEARQRVIDSTMCDYIMFLDADDMFMPRAVELLYGKAKPGGYDRFYQMAEKIMSNVNGIVSFLQMKTLILTLLLGTLQTKRDL